jgi:hypothetical protein
MALLTESDAKYPIAITLLEDGASLSDVTRTRGLWYPTYPPGGDAAPGFVQMSVWDLLEPMGIQSGLIVAPASLNHAIVILNTSSTPLVLAQMWIWAGTQVGYPALADFKNPGAITQKDVIPGARPHPTKPGAQLYGVGAYTFEPSTDRTGGVLAFSTKADKSGPLIAVAFQMGFLWQHPSFSVSTDVSKYRKDRADNDERILYNFWDTTEPGSTEVHSEQGANCYMAANHEKYPRKNGESQPGMCLVVWVR